MDFAKLFPKTALPPLTAKERQRASVLVVESDPAIRNRLRQILTSIDMGSVSDAANHALALQKIEEQSFSHVLFEAKKTNIPIREFLTKAIGIDKRLILIACSYEPTIDDVFDLLIYGARGYLVKPFTTESVDDAIAWATKGEPVSDSIVTATTRNEALASLVLSAFGKLTTIMKQSQHFETAKREIPKRQLALKRAVELARTFANGGDMALLETFIEIAAARSENGHATRLGKVRKNLETRREAGEDPTQSFLNHLTVAQR